MRILFFLPASMQARCFRKSDLDRLTAGHEVVLSGAESDEDLASLWRKHAAEMDCLVTGWSTPALTEVMLDKACRLQLIVHAAGSVKHLIPDSTWRRGIRVASTRGALAIGVAETTLGLIISGLKGFFPANELTRDGGWKTAPTDIGGARVRELFGLTIGVIGASTAGRQLIRLLKAFEVRICVHDPYLNSVEAEALGVEPVSLEQLLQISDVISLHAPSLPQTRHMLDRKQFAAMKDNAIFINTARGTLVNESALIEELQTKRIWAMLDVTDPEPPAADHPFRKLSNVVLLPHIAGAVANGCYRMGRSAVNELLAFDSGEALADELDESMLATMA